MANLLDYLDWRGDLPLSRDPFNEVDNLILAELSFVDFGGIVPDRARARRCLWAKRLRPTLQKLRADPSIWACWCQIRSRRCCAAWRRHPVPGYAAQRLCGSSGHGEGGAVRGADHCLRRWGAVPLFPGNGRHAGRMEGGLLSQLHEGSPGPEKRPWNIRRPWPASIPA